MANEEMFEDEFIINLTIEGTSKYEEVEVKVTDPFKTIRDQIASIVQVFELPKVDGGGMPTEYHLGLLEEGQEDKVVLEETDEDGRELTLVDYNIQAGDHLLLFNIPIAG